MNYRTPKKMVSTSSNLLTQMREQFGRVIARPRALLALREILFKSFLNPIFFLPQHKSRNGTATPTAVSTMRRDADNLFAR